MGDALSWLEALPAPRIFAPEAAAIRVGYRLSVPHNAMDIVGGQWSRGADGNPAEHRTMKSLRPMRLPDDAVVNYVWKLEGSESETAALITASRSVVALGWGVDLVVGNGEVVDSARVAEMAKNLVVWEPRRDGRRKLRAPISGTLEDLARRHAAFLARVSFAEPTLRPPPALSTFSIVSYARSDQPRATEIAGFSLMRAESDRFRAFDVARRGMAVSGMLRHAVRVAAERAGWDESRVNASVLGHDAGDGTRLLLAPVPSIEPRGDGAEAVGAIRRVMVFSTDVVGTDTTWASRALGGMDLIDEKTGEIQAVLTPVPGSDRVLERYISEARRWTTVTPVVLPGHDDPGGIRERLRNTRDVAEQRSLIDRLMKRREGLVRKALRHAGLGDELAFAAEIETRETGFLAGVDKASRFAVPSHLVRSPRLHVKLTWPVKVSGPLCIGRGRFSGLGLFVALRE